MNHIHPFIEPLHWSRQEFYLRQCESNGMYLTQPYHAYNKATHIPVNDLNIVAIFRVRPKYVAKRVDVQEVTKTIEDIRDKVVVMYNGQMGLQVPGAYHKIEAADEIFTELFNRVNLIYQS